MSPSSGRKKPFVFTKNLRFVQIFCENYKKYHVAAGESGFHLVKRPV